MQRAQLLRTLVADSHYVIDEHVVASAILARAAARGLVGDAAFRNDIPARRRVRSFRRSSQARSFRPSTLGGPFDRHRMATHMGLM